MFSFRQRLRFLLYNSQRACRHGIESPPIPSFSKADVVVKSKKAGQKSSTGADHWKAVLIAEREKELKAEHKRYSIVQENRAQQSQIIRYAITEDISSVISVIYQRVKAVGNKGKLTEEDDQFISCSLMIVLKSLERILQNKEELNSSEILSMFFSFANLWDHIRIFGDDMKICSVLLYDKFDLWSQLRATDESSEEIDQILALMEGRLRKLVKKISLENSQLFLSSSDRDHLIKLLVDLDANLDSKKRYSNHDTMYDQSISLLEHFRDPVAKQAYQGNPYQLDGITKENYIELFPDHIATEKASWLYVENYLDCSKEGSMLSAEGLIDSWGWLEKLQFALERLLEDRVQNPLRLIVKIVHSKELAKMILESIKAVCSQGQNLVPITVFHYDIVAPILRSVHSKFVQKLGINEVEIAFDEFHTEARRQMATFLTQAIIDACKFPVAGVGATQMLDAFSIRNVAIEEESYISEEGRITLSRMLAINSKLLNLLDDHPFKHIVFPTHQLPMTVPPRPWCDSGMGGPEYTRRSAILRNLAEYKQVDINRQMRKRLKSPSVLCWL
ncbi:unnamed protein product [Angiostrongylus costaricensis]|uniref:RPOL_N domain-containing protein n=1 Tax=Angiostrongylus costaricensis TaxID=334426 RepID=A0A0R3PTD9_ANGCS|nr:unnamed protein product [Angiostrongylus costaricensis]